MYIKLLRISNLRTTRLHFFSNYEKKYSYYVEPFARFNRVGYWVLHKNEKIVNQPITVPYFSVDLK